MDLYGHNFKSRLILGTSRYPSLNSLKNAITDSETEIVTIALRRAMPSQKTDDFYKIIKDSECHLLPNTAGCYTVDDAVTTAHLAREIFKTNWIKLEVIGHKNTLQPDPFGTLTAAQILCREGFEVFPYMTEDLVLAEQLLQAGCKVLMPWGSYIGSGQGLLQAARLEHFRKEFPEIPLIVDAGIGRPSDAAQAMELGFDGVLLNTAVAQARYPALMARAMKDAVKAGRAGYQAGIMQKNHAAIPSTPETGKAEFKTVA